MNHVTPTGIEIMIPENALMVSKSDNTGKIIYCNDQLPKFSGFEKKELIAQTYSIFANPSMPRCIYQLLWNKISSGKDIIVYLNNLCKNGDNFWVRSHIRPVFDNNKNIRGYHSNNIQADKNLLPKIKNLYEKLLLIEKEISGKDEAINASKQYLENFLKEKGVSYEEFVYTL